MILGVPREIKTDEHRVALVPAGAELLTGDGHTVFVQAAAGQGSGFEDAEYAAAGAQLVETADELFGRAELIVKVKEPQPTEIDLLGRGQIVFTYFHFAASRGLTDSCLGAGITAVAYETLRESAGPPAVADSDERGRRQDVHPGGRQVP